MSFMGINIRSDNGYDFCPACSFCETELCHFCDEGDQFEQAEDDAFAAANVGVRELASA